MHTTTKFHGFLMVSRIARFDQIVRWKEEIVSFDINKEVITRTALPTNIGIHNDLLQMDNYVGVKDGAIVVLNDSTKPKEDEYDATFFRQFNVW